MNILSPELTVGQIVVDNPLNARVFERFDIDYCCGGRTPLSEACRRKGLDMTEVLRVLREEEVRAAADSTTVDWRARSMTQLADHIESTHHAFLRRELPRLALLIEKVVRAHGQRRPEFLSLKTVFEEFCAEIGQHMLKEERILFPMIRMLEQPGSSRLATAHCGGIDNPIRVMEHEHDSAGRALADMRRLCEDYVPSVDACNTWRALYAGLAELEADMHQHVHKENNILFPAAHSAEQSAAPRPLHP